MDRYNISKSASKLNFSRRQADLFQQIILIGNQMSDALLALDRKGLLPTCSAKLGKKWGELMGRLADMLI